MRNAIEVAIDTIDAKIAALESAKQHLLDAHADATARTVDEPKVRKTRKRRAAGLPSAVPPASDANYAGKL